MPADRENALGWKDVGKVGSKEEGLAYIKEVWTDMRPLSLRKRRQQDAWFHADDVAEQAVTANNRHLV